MDIKSSLGFGFFNRARSKNRKRSERQLADMYSKVAIRGSIQHVWGDELPRVGRHAGRADLDSARVNTIRPAGPRSQTMPTSLDDPRGSAVFPSEDQGIVQAGGHAPSEQEKPVMSDLAPPLRHVEPVGPAETSMDACDSSTAGTLFVQEAMIISVEQRPDTTSPSPQSHGLSACSSPTSVRSMSFESNSRSQPAIYKKFSFGPSTISLVPPRSASGSSRDLRRASLAGPNHPYAQSHRSSIFSASTPSFSRAPSFRHKNRSDDHVSIADDDRLSPSSSLHYATSIISRISSGAADLPINDNKTDETIFLPGQIYAPDIPDALRSFGSLPVHYDEDEEDDDDDETCSIAGLSEVNAGYSSDSDFSLASTDAREGTQSEDNDTFHSGRRRGSGVTVVRHGSSRSQWSF